MKRNDILKKRAQAVRRAARTRAKIQGTAERPRMSVFRSQKHISVQLIDDAAGRKPG
jgi:large subunit ribosomal protein L18